MRSHLSPLFTELNSPRSLSRSLFPCHLHSPVLQMIPACPAPNTASQTWPPQGRAVGRSPPSPCSPPSTHCTPGSPWPSCPPGHAAGSWPTVGHPFATKTARSFSCYKPLVIWVTPSDSSAICYHPTHTAFYFCRF